MILKFLGFTKFWRHGKTSEFQISSLKFAFIPSVRQRHRFLNLLASLTSTCASAFSTADNKRIQTNHEGFRLRKRRKCPNCKHFYIVFDTLSFPQSMRLGFFSKFLEIRKVHFCLVSSKTITGSVSQGIRYLGGL